MVLADVNVLIYALRPDVPQHSLCRSWLSRVVEGEAAYAVSRQVLSSVVRISTTSKAFRMPCTLDEAFAFCASLANQPHCRVVEPGEDHWRIFERLCRDTDTRGPRVTDAWFAALAIEHGCEWITLDRDFARFPGLRWSTPTAR